jgi:hypothetical protein
MLVWAIGTGVFLAGCGDHRMEEEWVESRFGSPQYHEVDVEQIMVWNQDGFHEHSEWYMQFTVSDGVFNAWVTTGSLTVVKVQEGTADILWNTRGARPEWFPKYPYDGCAMWRVIHWPLNRTPNPKDGCVAWNRIGFLFLDRRKEKYFAYALKDDVTQLRTNETWKTFGTDVVVRTTSKHLNRNGVVDKR